MAIRVPCVNVFPSIMASSDCDDHINKLPDGILPEIFSYLPLTDRKTASLVCRLWGQEAFSARVLADVEFVLTYLNQATVLELLRNSTRLYRNVIVYEMFTDSFKLVVGFLDKFGTTIEGFNLNDSEAKPAQLKAYADMMPNLKRLTTFMTKMEKIPNEPLVFPVLSWLHEVHVRFWTDEALNRYQFDVLRMAPNLQRLHLASTDSNGNVRMFEVLKGCSNQLKSLKLCIFSIEYPRCKLRFDNLEVFKLRGQIDDVDRLLQLFQGLSELKVLHLNVMIKKSELETICNRCTKLEIMNIETDMLENGSLIYLCNLPNLQVIMIKLKHIV